MAEDTRVGTDLAGYRIQAVLGRGGMGVVYLAEDLRLARMVALKLLAQTVAESESFRHRFLRETKIAASIDHPNIVPIYDAGEADGVLYLVMRYVEGTDLKRLILEQGRLELERTVAIVAQLAAALDTAHARGLVHRDVKPSNVLLLPRKGPAAPDHVYLSDFGLTKRSASESGLTGTGQFVGTLDYAAPEQFEGRRVDARTDVYSLGCVVYECLVGAPPFDRETDAEVMYAHLFEDPPGPSAQRPGLPRSVDAVIARAMARAPDERPPSGEALVSDLQSALGYQGAGTRSPPAGRGRRAVRFRPRVGIGVAALVTLALGAFLYFRSTGDTTIVPGPNTVARIGAATGAFDEVVGVGTVPTGVAVGAGSVWVINQRDQTVTRVDPEARSADLSRSTLGTPTGIAFGENAVWIANGFGGQTGVAQVVKINPEDNLAEPVIESLSAHAIVVAFGSVWLADPLEDRVYRYDPTSGERMTTIRFGEGSSPNFLAVGDGAASGIWVVNRLGDNVAWIDPETDMFKAYGVESPTAVAASGHTVWVTSNSSDTVTRLDASTGTPVRTLTLAEDDVPDGPWNVVVAPDGVWVTSSLTPVVAKIDDATNAIVETLAVHGISDALAVDPDGDVWVTIRER